MERAMTWESVRFDIFGNVVFYSVIDTVSRKFYVNKNLVRILAFGPIPTQVRFRDVAILDIRLRVKLCHVMKIKSVLS